MKPARYDLPIYQRASFRRRFKLPFNCTGHEVEAQVWSARRVTKLVQFDVEWVDREKGEFDLVADFSQTRSVTRNGEWDLMVIYPNGERYYWVEGAALFDRGYTEPA